MKRFLAVETILLLISLEFFDVRAKYEGLQEIMDAAARDEAFERNRMQNELILKCKSGICDAFQNLVINIEGKTSNYRDLPWKTHPSDYFPVLTTEITNDIIDYCKSIALQKDCASYHYKNMPLFEQLKTIYMNKLLPVTKMITAKFVVLLITASCVRSNDTDETEQGKVLANFSLGSFIPSVSKITLPKLPAIPKRNTITLTTTVLTQETKFVPIYPTCIHLEKVQSECDGYLETIIPTPILPTAAFLRDTQSEHDEEMIERRHITPSSTQSIQPTATVDSSRMNIIEPSEHEYEYTRSDNVTPSILEKIQLESSIDERSKPSGNYLESLLGPKYEISTAHLTLTKVVRYTDYANKATIIATNCLPAGLRYPFCSPYPFIFAKKKKKQNLHQAIHQTVDKIYQHINKFVSSNPHDVLGTSSQGSGYFYGILNSDGLPFVVRTAELFPVRRSIDDGKITGESS